VSEEEWHIPALNAQLIGPKSVYVTKSGFMKKNKNRLHHEKMLETYFVHSNMVFEQFILYEPIV
jgi:hypothetical protein